ELSVLPNPVDFGTVYVGKTKELDVTMTNKGTSPIHVSSVTLTEGTSMFGLDTGGKVTWDLDPGGEAGFKVTYTPPLVSAGDQGKIVVDADKLDPVELLLKGRASQAPAIKLSANQVDFGEVQVGAKLDKTLTISNIGGQDLEITKIELTAGISPELDFSPKSIDPIAPGKDVTVTFSYSPVDEGTDSGGMMIECNDPDNDKLGVVISGTGVNPTLVVDPAGYDFKDVFKGATSQPASFQLSKTGSGTLQVLKIEIDPNSDPVFQVDLSGIPNGLPKNLDSPGSRIFFGATFTPAGEGMFSGNIKITTNDLDGPVKLIPLAGHGVGCPAGYWDANHDPSDGCEYGPCTKTGPEVCDKVDNDCNGQVDEGPISQLCGTPNGAAVVSCKDGACQIDACNPGQWDNNNDFSDGCEYGPCYKTALACDKKDNDCNGKIDDAPADQLCQIPQNADGVACLDGQCQVASCKDGYFDVDRAYGDGCECTQDCWGRLAQGTHVTGINCQGGNTCVLLGCEDGYYDLDKVFDTGCECFQKGTPGGRGCADAVRLPDVSDNNTPITVSSNIPWAANAWASDWFVFKAVDSRGDDNQGKDHFKVQVKFTSNPGNQYQFDLYKQKGAAIDCSKRTMLCSQQKTGDLADDHPGGGTNTEDQCNCIPSGQPLTPGRDHCDDDTAWYFLQVYRIDGVSMTCDPYVVEIRNGGGCP
ncbi:MAG: choice-of-anchor D domain-containing protein, partial [Deltaproteobacteria bacterium]|nr:choice-of-anchor D domain-containing protein [Deltaproteobacteria bacterium]